MLYGYAPAATQDNWVHEAMFALLVRVHELVDNDAPFAWPELLRAQDRDRLETRTSVRDACARYCQALRAADATARRAARSLITDQHALRELLAGRQACALVDVLDERIGATLKQIGEACCKLLGAIGVRQAFYARICQELPPGRPCPFCGLDRLKRPDARIAQALDHYLPRSKYPVLAASLENLVPICRDCNEIKREQDPLASAGGTLTRLPFPFDATLETQILLDDSEPFAGRRHRPRWKIEFQPMDAARVRWEALFELRERYGKELDDGYRAWLTEVANYAARTDKVGLSLNTILSEYTDVLERHHETVEAIYLKLAFFRWLQREVAAEDQRLAEHLGEIIEDTRRDYAARRQQGELQSA